MRMGEGKASKHLDNCDWCTITDCDWCTITTVIVIGVR